ncbi:hypothetical protein C8R47DRAFT_1079258 [Mycena vitilis]|nr:hypothetical protein C8R47DRAFT_1079258 [Mycena vitilis]
MTTNGTYDQQMFTFISKLSAVAKSAVKKVKKTVTRGSTQTAFATFTQVSVAGSGGPPMYREIYHTYSDDVDPLPPYVELAHEDVNDFTETPAMVPAAQARNADRPTATLRRNGLRTDRQAPPTFAYLPDARSVCSRSNAVRLRQRPSPSTSCLASRHVDDPRVRANSPRRHLCTHPVIRAARVTAPPTSSPPSASASSPNPPLSSTPDASAPSNDEDPRSGAAASEHRPALGLTFPSTSVDDLEADPSSPAPSSVQSSLDDAGDDLISTPDASAPTNSEHENAHADAETSVNLPALGLTSVDNLSHDEAEHASLSSPSSVKLSFDGVGHPISAPDASAPSYDEDPRSGAEDSETLPALGVPFLSASSADDLSHDEAERPSPPSPSSPDPGASTNGANVRTDAEDSEDPPALGLPFASIPSVNNDLGREEAENPSPFSPSSVGSSLEDVDLNSPSPPVTSISMPSTARPLGSPSASDCTLWTDTPLHPVDRYAFKRIEASGAADRSTETPSSVMHERPGDEHAPDDAYVHPHSDSTFHRLDSGDPFLRPQCTLFDPAGVTDGNDSESLPSLLIRPATASALSDDEDGRDEHLEADTEGQSDSEVEYLDEYQYPALTPLSITGLEELSLPLSLAGSFEFLNDWEVVPFRGSQDALLGDNIVGVGSGDVHAPTGCADDIAKGKQALKAVPFSSEESQTSLSESAADAHRSEAGGSGAMENGAHTVDDCELPPPSPSFASAHSFVADAQASSEAARSDVEERFPVAPAALLDASAGSDPQNETVFVDSEDKVLFRLPSSPAASPNHRFEDEFHGISGLPALHFHLTSFPGADDILTGGQASPKPSPSPSTRACTAARTPASVCAFRTLVVLDSTSPPRATPAPPPPPRGALFRGSRRVRDPREEEALPDEIHHSIPPLFTHSAETLASDGPPTAPLLLRSWLFGRAMDLSVTGLAHEPSPAGLAHRAFTNACSSTR